jgi:AraC-like DNA-binding protein
LKATIERLLIEPGLKPERVAAETGISVRYANALLSEENSSIERYIAERRLERCRSALEDSAQAHRSIGEIAFKWGFSDLSHFGRRFKARYGLTPTDYKRQAAQVAPDGPFADRQRTSFERAHAATPIREHA